MGEGEGTPAPEATTPAPEGEAGDAPKESPLDRAERLNKSTLEAEKRIDEKLAKADTARAESLMDGTANSATEPTQKKETDAEYRKRINKELSEGKFNGKSG